MKTYPTTPPASGGNNSQPTVKKAATSWIVTGTVLIVAGAIMLPTVVLTAIGAGFILGGIAVITAAYLRTNR